MILERINGPDDIKKLKDGELALLAEEIRSFLIEKISRTGGHLASNLGVVELTMALFLAFDLPKDKIIWDVGHQSYTHKILSGRKENFDGLRQYGGLSGFPKRKESPFDAFDTGHSSTSISAGLGMALGRDVRGDDYSVISVIGDGALDISNEAEIPSIIYRAFTALGLKRFQIRVNNRKILNGFYAMLGLTEKSGDIMRTVDKLDKIGPEKVKAILTGDLTVAPSDADEILKFIAISGGNDAVLSALEGYRGRNEIFDQGLEELNTVVRYLADFGVPAENFAVDLTIARGLDYYTGTVYETTLLDHPEIGSVCSGGRYDNLAEYYTDRQLPGAGISIGLTRLFYVLGEQGMLNPDLPTAPADVLILPMTAELTPAIQLSTRLRAAGVRTQLYTEQKKFKAKMNYADKIGVPYVVFLGDDEVSGGVVACKDMTSGEQTTLPFDETLQRIREGLALREQGSVIAE